METGTGFSFNHSTIIYQKLVQKWYKWYNGIKIEQQEHKIPKQKLN